MHPKVLATQKVAKMVAVKAKAKAPLLLMIGATVGLGVTIGCAIENTKTYMKTLDKKMTKRQKFVKILKVYSPTIIAATFTTSCIIGGHQVSMKRNVALAGAYKLSEETLKKYKTKWAEHVPEKKRKEYEEEIIRETPGFADVPEWTDTDEKGLVLCFDLRSGRYFKTNLNKIEKAQNELNRLLIDEMYVSLNDAYCALETETIGLGDDLGWNVDDGLVDFVVGSMVTDAGQPILTLDFRVWPRPKYY